jgi:hypothetical protein
MLFRISGVLLFEGKTLNIPLKFPFDEFLSRTNPVEFFGHFKNEPASASQNSASNGCEQF